MRVAASISAVLLVAVMAGAAPTGKPRTVEIAVTTQVVQPDWRGFGYQDTLFLWMEHQGRRVGTEDIRLNVERVRSMNPSVVRLFTDMRWWNPTAGRYTWDSEGMNNLYQVLNLYRDLGSDVILTVWGRLPPGILGADNAPGDMDAFARSVGECLEHLVRTNGYTHIRYLILYNEPDLEFKPPPGDVFAQWAAMLRAMDRELGRRGLREQIRLMGPDDAKDEQWLRRSTEELGDVLDAYASHHYDGTAESAGQWLRQRVKLVLGSPHPKPWWITEFGGGPHQDNYNYGLFVVRYGLLGLNGGARGMLIWSLTDMFFPGERGDNPWGLWKYRDEDWAVRPVFYAYGLLTRFARAGMSAYRIESPDELAAGYLRGSAGQTLIVANPGTQTRIAVRGLPYGVTLRRYRYTREAVGTGTGRQLEAVGTVRTELGWLHDDMPAESVVVYTTVAEPEFKRLGELKKQLTAQDKLKEALKVKSEMDKLRTHTAHNKTLDLGQGVTMKLVLIPAGSFLMGTSQEAQKDPDIAADIRDFSVEVPQHRVTISKPFFMGLYEVTQEQYEFVMKYNPSKCRGRNLPVETVTWDDAVAFCKEMSAKTGRKVRLPTEAEWEYACRAGSDTHFCFGDNRRVVGDYGWYVGNSIPPLPVGQNWWEISNRPLPVGQKKPNRFGLYDMHGNVSEWCADWFDAAYYANSPATDPPGPAAGTERVLRGGAVVDTPPGLRSAKRLGRNPTQPQFIQAIPFCYGFRVAVEARPDELPSGRAPVN